MKTVVVMRARNDMPLVKETVDKVLKQTIPTFLLAFDNGSTDGTREYLQAHANALVDIPADEYVPGRVLNNGAGQANSDIVVFLNSDCTPADGHWLENLLKPFEDPQVGAVFGRQLPRPGCTPVAARDIEDTFGDGLAQDRWRHCFSMASSAIRKSAWKNIPFSESVKYSEDIDWSWRLNRAGFQVRYAPESCVFHSHNYTNEQWNKRQYGEGKAEALIFPWSAWQKSLLRYSLLPFLRQVLADMIYSLKKHQWNGLWIAPGYRYSQMIGRRAGFTSGLKKSA
jgi:rhamnosyltransferase